MYDYEPEIDLEKDWQSLLPLFAVSVIVVIMAVLAAYALLLQILRLLGI